MATNVFGTPVTDETLKGMVEYHDKKITQLDRARVALEMKNAEGKDENARRRLEELGQTYNDSPATMGLIYNATGHCIKFVTDRDWNGHLHQSPYPTIIANGQWGIFLHGKTRNGDDFSKAAVVYSGKNQDGVDKNWCISWANNKKNECDDNRVFGEVQEEGHYDLSALDDYIRPIYLDGEGKVHKRLAHEANQRGGLLITSIGNNEWSFLEAILTLPDALY